MALFDLKMACNLKFYDFGNCDEIGISPPFNVYIFWSQPRVSLGPFLSCAREEGILATYNELRLGATLLLLGQRDGCAFVQENKKIICI